MVKPEPLFKLGMTTAVDDGHTTGFQYPGEFGKNPLMRRPAGSGVIRQVVEHLVNHDRVSAFIIDRQLINRALVQFDIARCNLCL